eukprot:3290360-Rhodomonas_salina.4
MVGVEVLVLRSAAAGGRESGRAGGSAAGEAGAGARVPRAAPGPGQRGVGGAPRGGGARRKAQAGDRLGPDAHCGRSLSRR